MRFHLGKGLHMEHWSSVLLRLMLTRLLLRIDDFCLKSSLSTKTRPRIKMFSFLMGEMCSCASRQFCNIVSMSCGQKFANHEIHIAVTYYLLHFCILLYYYV